MKLLIKNGSDVLNNGLVGSLSVKNSSHWTDYVVKPPNNDNFDSSTSTFQTTNRREIIQLQNQLIPIYCTVLGLIIVGMLCYVIYKMWKQKQNLHITRKMPLSTNYNNNNNNNNNNINNTSGFYLGNDALLKTMEKDLQNSYKKNRKMKKSKYHHHHHRNETTSEHKGSYQPTPLLASLGLKNKSLDGSSIDLEKGLCMDSDDKAKWNKMENSLLNQQVYCLPVEQFNAVVFSLADESSGKGWIDLAKHEGFTEADIVSITQLLSSTLTNNNNNNNNNNNKQFNSSTQQHQLKQDQIRSFLKQWSLRDPDQNTVKKLIQSLHEIQRQDTALLLRIYLRKSVNINNNNNLISEPTLVA